MESLSELRRCTRQPPVDDCLPQCGRSDDRHVDENRRVSVEMGDREEGFGIRCEDGLLLFEVVDANGQNGPIGWDGVTEPLDVRLAERPFPRERPVVDEPGSMTVTLAFCDLGELGGSTGDIIERRHEASLWREGGRGLAVLPLPGPGPRAHGGVRVDHPPGLPLVEGGTIERRRES